MYAALALEPGPLSPQPPFTPSRRLPASLASFVPLIGGEIGLYDIALPAAADWNDFAIGVRSWPLDPDVGAIAFDQVWGRLQLPSGQLAADPAVGETIAWWWRVDSFGSGNYAIAFASPDNVNTYGLWLDTTTTLYTRRETPTWETWTGVRPALGEWHHYAVRYRAVTGNNESELFIDGVSQGVRTVYGWTALPVQRNLIAFNTGGGGLHGGMHTALRFIEPLSDHEIEMLADPDWLAYDDQAADWLPAPGVEAGSFKDFGTTIAIATLVDGGLLERDRDIAASTTASGAVTPAMARTRDLATNDLAPAFTIGADLEVVGVVDFATDIAAAVTVSAGLAATVNFGASTTASLTVSALLGREFALVAPLSFASALAAPNVGFTAVDDGPYVVPVNGFVDGDASTNDVQGEAPLQEYERTGLGPFFGDIVLDPDGQFTYLANLGVTNESDAIGYRVRDQNANISNDALIQIQIRGYVDFAVNVSASLAAAAVPGFFRGFGAAVVPALTVVADLLVSGEQEPFHALEARIWVEPVLGAGVTVQPVIEGGTVVVPSVDGDIEVNQP